jgi:hypothetical protein
MENREWRIEKREERMEIGRESHPEPDFGEFSRAVEG